MSCCSTGTTVDKDYVDDDDPELGNATVSTISSSVANVGGSSLKASLTTTAARVTATHEQCRNNQNDAEDDDVEADQKHHDKVGHHNNKKVSFTTACSDDDEEDNDASDGSNNATCKTSTSTNESIEYSNSSSSSSKENDDNAAADNIGLSKVVTRWKILVLVVLIVSMMITSITVYSIIRKSEVEQFHQLFHDDADKLLEAIGGRMDLSLSSVDALLVSIMSHAKHTNQIWPFVTIPDFYNRASKVITLTSHAVVYLSIYPYVSVENRLQWENYTTHNNDWVLEGIIQQELDPSYKGPIIYNYTTWDVVYDNYEYCKDNPGEGNGTERNAYNDVLSSHNVNGNEYEYKGYMPIWQSSPVVPRFPPYNWDLLSSVDTSSIKAVFNSKKVVVSEAYLIPDDSADDATKAENSVFADWFRDFINPNEVAMEPVSDIYIPMFDVESSSKASPPSSSLHSSSTANVEEEDESNSNSKSKIVGFIALSVYWRDMIRGILPPGSDVLVVFENPCNPAFTYRISGPESTFLGVGDLHDPRFDNHLEESATIHELNKEAVENFDYTGTPINGDYCPFKVRIYPSIELYNLSTSSQPIWMSVTVALIFVLTAGTFLIYDNCVERRQRRVVTTASKANLNVALLEEKVKERTYKLEQSNKHLEEANHKVVVAAARQLEHFACMSHEIRTPLNCILGMSSLLKEETESLVSLNHHQHKESIQMIMNSSELLKSVVDDVLDYSKLESNNVDINIQRVNLQSILTTVVHSITNKTLTEEKRIVIKTNYDPYVNAYIDIDGRRLQQILYNLLGNAIKFSKEDGIVELSVSIIFPPSDDARGDGNGVAVGASPTQQIPLLRFQVLDNGKGIHSNDFEKIFKPFLQATRSSSSSKASDNQVQEGTGLGLAITSRLVEAMNGSISVDSCVGEWTEFTVDFAPLLSGIMPSTSATSSSFCADVQNISRRLINADIVLVDNSSDAALLKILQQRLQPYQLKMKQYQSMAEAMQCITSKKSSIFLINESLYTETSLLSSSQYATFGPQYLIKKGQKHYRSLLEVLPSVLVNELGSILENYQSADSTNVAGGCNEASSKISQNQQCNNETECQPLGHDAVTMNVKNVVHISGGATENEEQDQIKNLKVLIAEDNLVNQKVLKRILGRLGVETITVVDNGLKAVQCEANEQYDIVFMDMQMPIMDGTEACRQIVTRGQKCSKNEGGSSKKEEKNDDCSDHHHNNDHPIAQVIFVTAHAMESFENECYIAGASGFIAKPCKIDDVRRCLQERNTAIKP